MDKTENNKNSSNNFVFDIKENFFSNTSNENTREKELFTQQEDLYQAISSNNLQLANDLLSKCDINQKTNGQTILQKILNSNAINETSNQLALCWLIKNKADLADTSDKGLTIFDAVFQNIDYKNINWPILELLLDESFKFFNKKIKNLFYASINDLQFNVVIKILEGNKKKFFITEFDITQFSKILKFTPAAIFEIVNQLSEQKLFNEDSFNYSLIKEILLKIIENPDHHFLLENPLILSSINKHFNLKLKDSSESSNEAFRSLITTSLVHDFLGSHHLLRKSNLGLDNNKKISNNEIFQFFIGGLKYLQSTYKERLNAQSKDIKNLMQQSEFALNIAEKIEATRLLSREFQYIALKMISDSILTKIQNLSSSTSSLILPWGWKGYKSENLLIEILKKGNDITLLIYEQNKINEYLISKKEYEDPRFFTKLFEPLAHEEEYSSDDVFLQLRDYQVKGTHSTFSTKHLMSDFGYFRSMETFMKRSMGKRSARKILFLLFCDTLDFKIDNIQKHQNILKELAPALSIESLPSLADTILLLPPQKLANMLLKAYANHEKSSSAFAEDVEKLKGVIDKWNKLLPETFIENKLIEISPKEKMLSKSIDIQSIKLPEFNHIDVPGKKLEYADLPQVPAGFKVTPTSAGELLEKLEKMVSFIKTLNSLRAFELNFTSSYAAHQLRLIGKILLKEIKSEKEDRLLKSLKNSTETTEKIIDALAALSGSIYSSSTRRRGSSINALNITFVVIWHLACILSEQKNTKNALLKEYSLRYLNDLLKHDDVNDFSLARIHFSRNLSEKWLLNGCLPNQEENLRDSLFEPKQYIFEDKDVEGVLSPTILEYLKTFLPTNEKSDPPLCKKLFEDEYTNLIAEKYYGSRKPDWSSFRTFFYYINQLPAIPKYFFHLRNLSFAQHSILSDTPFELKDFNPTITDLLQCKSLNDELSYNVKKLIFKNFFIKSPKIRKLMIENVNKNFVNQLNFIPGYKGTLSKDVSNCFLFGHPLIENKIKVLNNDNERFLFLNSYFTEKNYEYSPLSIYNLIDLYENSFEKLSENTHQKYFVFHLKQWTALGKEFTNNNSTLPSELMSFLSKGSTFFEKKIQAKVDPIESLNGLLFLLEQKIFVLHLIDNFSLTVKNSDSLDEVRNKIKNLISKTLHVCFGPEDNDDSNMKQNKAYMSQIKESRLWILMLLTYENEQIDITKFDVLNLLSAQMKLSQLKGLSNNEILYMIIEEAEEVIISHAEVILEYINKDQDFKKEVIDLFLTSNNIPLLELEQKNHWVKSGSGFFTNKATELGEIEINLLAGSVKLNGELASKIPYELTLDMNYENVIGMDLSYAIHHVEENYLEGFDKVGKVRIYYILDYLNFKNLSKIVRQFPDRKDWYEYQPSVPFEHIPKDFSDRKLNCWKLQSNKSPHFLFCEPLTHKIVYQLNKNGSFNLNDNLNENYEWKKITSFNFFDPHSYLWQQTNTFSDPMQRLVFPSYSLVEGGDPLTFERHKVKNELKWVIKEYPNLWMAKKQVIKGWRHFSRFLILEDSRGAKKALIILENRSLLLEMTAEILTPKSITGSILAAYHTFSSAVHINDYKMAINYLKNSISFSEYTKEELGLFVKIYQSYKENGDESPESDAVRLYCAWLLHDNATRNPKSKAISLDKKELTNLLKRYLERETLTPIHLQITSHLTSFEISSWPLIQEVIEHPENKFKEKSFSQEALGKINKDKNTLRRIFYSKENNIQLIPIESRPSEDIKNNFYYLYQMAKSSSWSEQNQISKLLLAMNYDDDEVNAALRICLKARLSLTQGTGSEAIKELCFSLESLMKKGSNLYESSLEKINELIENIYYESSSLKQFNQYSNKKSRTSVIEQIYLKESQFSEQIIPSEKPKKSYQYTTQLNDDFFNELYDTYFTGEEESLSHKMTSFNFPSNRKNSPGIQNFLDDYKEGFEKNNIKVKHRIKSKYNIQSRLSAIKESLASEKEHTQLRMAILEKSMINLINQGSKEDILYEQIMEMGLLKQKLDFTVCKALFLINSEEEYRKILGNTGIKDFSIFHNLIGNYHFSKTTLQKLDRLQKQLENLPSENDLEAFAAELSKKRCYNIEKTPYANVLLIFESEADVLLYSPQIQGLKEMIDSDTNVLKQLLQGGGKTFTWGHILALVKADGYHLSLHVAPTETFESNIMDMRHHSGRLFGQREHTFKFDDSSEYFTIDYLTNIRDLLVNAIKNRHYVSLNKETLWALRTKFNKGQYDKSYSQESMALLKEILSILRERGIFTFDEFQKAVDENKELNMPFGNHHSPKESEIALIGHILLNAATAIDKDGHILLDIENNKHPLQIESQNDNIKLYVVEKLINESPWKEIAERHENGNKIVSNYFLGITKDLPSILDQKEIATEAILIHKLLGDNWLRDRLSKYVNEDLGFSAFENDLRIAIPFVYNMTPLEESEFSDLYVMIMNTLICYMVNGISSKQVKAFIRSVQKEAWSESSLKEESDINFNVSDCQCAKDFFETTGIDLFSITPEEPKTIEIVRESLRKLKPQSIRLLFNFVRKEVLSKVALFDNQVGSNGQNLISMGKMFLAYSGSVDNPVSAPLNTKICLDKGTNGQTVDLFVRKGLPIEQISNERNSLLDLLDTHTSKDKIRAIIDIGNNSRGKVNKKVALDIAEKLKSHQKFKGVLFFDADNHLCCMMIKNKKITILNGTTRDIIIAETGLNPDELFSYYDQRHIVGVDIFQAPDTIALTTFNAGTTLEEICQGLRRLRQLDVDQNIIPVIKTEDFHAIINKLKNTTTDTSSNSEHRKFEETLTKEDLIVLSLLNQIDKEQNLTICIQKMMNVVQQLILDKSYNIENPELESLLFEKNRHLFITATTIDLYQEYAKEKKEISMESFLYDLKDKLTSNLIEKDKIFSIEELNDLSSILNKVIIDHLRLLPQKHNQVSKNSNDGTVIRQNIQISDNLAIREQVMERKLENINPDIPFNLFVPLSSKLFTNSNEFMTTTHFDMYNGCLSNADSNSNPFHQGVIKRQPASSEIWVLSQVLDKGLKLHKKHLEIFSKQLLVSSNYALTHTKMISLLPPLRKELSHMQLIYDESKEKKWSLLLISIGDADAFADLNPKLPNGKKIWLFRANDKLVQSVTEQENLDIFASEEVIDLFIQAFIFAGKVEMLERVKWKTLFSQWLDRTCLESSVDSFFEEKINQILPVTYLKSETYKTIQSKKKSAQTKSMKIQQKNNKLTKSIVNKKGDTDDLNKSIIKDNQTKSFLTLDEMLKSKHSFFSVDIDPDEDEVVKNTTQTGINEDTINSQHVSDEGEVFFEKFEKQSIESKNIDNDSKEVNTPSKTMEKYQKLINEGRKLPLKPVQEVQIQAYKEFITKGSQAITDDGNSNKYEFIKKMALKYLDTKELRKDVYKVIHTFRQLVEELELRLESPPLSRMSNKIEEIESNNDSHHFDHFAMSIEKNDKNQSNEDSHLYFENKKLVIAGVCDGHQDKKKISSLIATYVKTHFINILSNIGKNEDLTKDEKFFFALQEIVHRMHESDEVSQMEYGGSTFCLSVIDKKTGRIYTATLGDSEARLFREVDSKKCAKRLSNVKSWNSDTYKKWAEALSINEKALDTLKNNKFYWPGVGNVAITGAIGGAEIPAVTQEVFVTMAQLQEGDIIVLGTDGLWARYNPETLSEDEMDNKFMNEVIFKKTNNLAKECINFVETVNEGLKDDATVVAIKVKKK